MTLLLPKIRWIPVFIVLIFLALILFGWAAWEFDRSSRQSARHNYYYTIDLSYNTTIDNVTFFLPVPELNSSTFFTASLLNKTAYGVSSDWNLSIVFENGTPMLAIRAARMVPEYYSYPIALEPGVSVLPTTLVPGHEYSAETPVLMPVTVAVMEMSVEEIDTRHPVGHEPVFFPNGMFTPGSQFPAFDHTVPVYIRYTSEKPVALSLRISIHGSNAIWRGGWVSNTYSDTVTLELTHGEQGWIQGVGKLITAEGV